MADPAQERFTLSDDTIEIGRARIAAIRAQWTDRQPPRRPFDRTPATSSSTSDAFHPDRIAADMAHAAERERLTARVHELEDEVVHLRTALAAILHAAATAVTPSSSRAEVADAGEIDR